MTHFVSIPWTGLGLYGGYRGDRWLKNRIKVFKQFVLPSLQAQTNQNFIVWHAFRREERRNPIVKEFQLFMETTGLKNVFTFSGVPFWDDKHDDETAKLRLVETLHGAMQTLVNYTADGDVIWTLQPSDDCYNSNMVADVQSFFASNPEFQAISYTKGYIMDYTTLGLSEYNPKTNPPFFSIKFPKEIFIEPFKHMTYTGPYKSHEYIGDKLKLGTEEGERGFLVGCHGENISTYYDHPYRGAEILGDEKMETLTRFGLAEVPPIVLKKGLRRWILKQLPHPVRRKLRYWLGERLWSPIHNWIRR